MKKTNDVMDEVVQQKYNNNKYYASTFKHIQIKSYSTMVQGSLESYYLI